MAERKMLSLNPKDFVVGGLLNDVDVEFKSLQFVEWDYGGQGPTTLALLIGMLPAGDEQTVPQYWSVGSPDDFEAVNGGRGIDVKRNEDGEPTSSASALRQGSNFKIFADSLLNCGGKVEEDKLAAGDIGVFAGTKAHVLREAAPKRAGLEQREGRFEPTVLRVTRVISWPWDKGKRAAPAPRAKAAAPAAGAAPAESAATAPAAGPITPEIDKLATDLLLGWCAEAPTGVAMSTMRVGIYKTLSRETTALRSQVADACADEAWLTSKGFTVVGEMVKL